MCGRFTLYHPSEELLAQFQAAPAGLPLEPRYNIAPTQNVAALRAAGRRVMEPMRWGLVPSWAKDEKRPLINVRRNTLAEKPYFRTALAHRRCVIPASGFYEWAEADNPAEGGKTPFYFQDAQRKALALGGIWEERVGTDGAMVTTCAIVTTEPNALLGAIHDRMPVILQSRDVDLWLDPSADDVADLAALLTPFPDDGLRAYQVSRAVNSAAYEGPDCIAPVGEEQHVSGG